MRFSFTLAPVVLLAIASAARADDYKLHIFKKVTLSEKFYAEGAYYGDFDNDGKQDVAAGPFIYFGPDFKRNFEYRKAEAYDPKGYSQNFLTYAHDLNGDGWMDVIRVGWPGKETMWYENPGKAATERRSDEATKGHWAEHVAFPVTDNESPGFGDFIGDDGKPELVFNTGGQLGYASPDWKNPTAPWTFHPISHKGKWQRYTHGIGFGDVNGDGRNDMLETDGWWEQPESLEGDPQWKRHVWRFGNGGAQMFAYDVDGDGDNDVITSIHAHGFGLAWFEHYKEGDEIKFKEHRFMDDTPEKNRYGVKFSQLHSLDLIDMDGDGVKDIITGKRWWAHGPAGDAEPNAAAVVYWFRIVRTTEGGGIRATDGRGVDFVPYLIDDDSGVGTQVEAADLNGDGYPEVIVSNKKGTFVHIHEVEKVNKAQWDKAQPKVFEASGQ